MGGEKRIAHNVCIDLTHVYLDSRK